MNLDIPALAIGLLGGGSLAALVVFFALYKTERRRKKAEARKTEMEGDLLSMEYFRETVEQLKADNKELKADNKELKAEIKELRADVEELKDGKNELIEKLEMFEEAGKECHSCAFNTTVIPCPAIVKYKQLTK